MKKTFLTTILTLALILAMLAPTTTEAASKPYCRIYYDTYEQFGGKTGCYTLRYYAYTKDGFAKESASRLVKYRGNKMFLGHGSKEITVTTKLKVGSIPAWTTNGSDLCWIEKNSDIFARNYKTGKVRKLAEEAKSFSLNAESMVTYVTFQNGKKKTIKSLLSSTSTTPQPNPSPNPNPSPTPKPNPTPTPDKKEVKEWTDSASRNHIKFGKNEVIVDGRKVYLNDYRISDLCDSGIRFVGVTSSQVYLYEDSTSSLYRFKISNIFKPDKIKFRKGTKLENTVCNAKGYLTKVVTSSGTFTTKQLVAEKKWYPKKSYAMNKKGYCTYYLANSSKTYTLSLKGNKLYLGNRMITTGISRKSESFGFYGKYIRFVKGKNAYQAKISAPTKAKLWKKNVKKLTFSKKDGQVTGAK